MTEWYRCEDGHEFDRPFAEIMPHRLITCLACVPDPKLKGRGGPMVLCGKPLTLLRTEPGGGFAEAYAAVFQRN